MLGESSATQRAVTAAALLDRGFKGLFNGVMAQNLSRFQSRPSPQPPVNLRDQVCGKNRPKGEDDASVASLGPRFETMPPVPVFTGGADAKAVSAPAVASVGGGGSVNIPLPRLRPR